MEKIVSDERLHDYLGAYVKTLKLTAPKFRITEGSNKGDNFVGVVHRVVIEGIENGEVKKIQLVLKTTRLYMDDLILSSDKVTKMFQREILFYREVWPILKNTLKGHGGIVERFPDLYDVNDESGKEILMLKDLSSEGFVMAKSKIMDYPHLSLTIRCLGEFHACSFITRYADPTSFERFKGIEEPVFSPEPLFSQKTDKKDVPDLQKELFNIVLKALANEDKHYSERFQRFVDNMLQNMVDATDGKAAEPYAVVNHGDSWTNNILFKYDQENNPCDLRFIDLQICRYASPVLDLIYSIFCCCTQETRSKYFDQVIHEYYETLSKCIERAGYDPNILFPYEILSEHLIKFGKYAAGMAIYTLHIFTSNDADLQENFDINILQERLQTDNLYRNMLIGTFKDLVDRNYI